MTERDRRALRNYIIDDCGVSDWTEFKDAKEVREYFSESSFHSMFGPGLWPEVSPVPGYQWSEIADEAVAIWTVKTSRNIKCKSCFEKAGGREAKSGYWLQPASDNSHILVIQPGPTFRRPNNGHILGSACDFF